MIKPSIPFPRNETNQEKLERIRTTKLSKFEKGDGGSYKYWAHEEIDAEYEFNIKSDELYLLRAALKPSESELEESDRSELQSKLLEAEAKLNAIKNWYVEKGRDLPDTVNPSERGGMVEGYKKRVLKYESEQLKKSKKRRSAIENEFAQTDSGDDSTELDTSKPNSLETLRKSISEIPNFTWKDLKIELMSDSVIRFKIINSEIKGLRFSYTDLGMKDKRKTDLPNTMFEFLVGLIEMRGVFRLDDIALKDRSMVEKTISRLRGKLREITGIEGNPILFIKYPYPKRYETQFKTKDERPNPYRSDTD